MDERIRFVKYAGKQILQIDLSRCTGEEMLVLFERFRDLVARHPPKSVLVLADFTGAQFDKAAITRMKEVLVLDRPYVKRAAWVGTKSLPHVYYENVRSFSQRELPAFETRDQAMEWLVKD